MTTAAQYTISLASGEARALIMYPDGSYNCPFCSGAVISPAGWEQNEASNARIYAAQGDAYQIKAYPRWQRETWEARGCGNPMCLVSLNAAQLAETRGRIAAREAEADRQARIHEGIMTGLRESREREAAAWDEISARAREAGQCIKCLRASSWQSRPKLVRHRDAGNCPQARKYAR